MFTAAIRSKRCHASSSPASAVVAITTGSASATIEKVCCVSTVKLGGVLSTVTSQGVISASSAAAPSPSSVISTMLIQKSGGMASDRPAPIWSDASLVRAWSTPRSNSPA